MKISIVYWSATGNTEAMAGLIKEGAEGAGHTVDVKTVDRAGAADITDVDVAVLGCPAMGAEVLEEGEFEPYIQSILPVVSGRKVALFGSYDWGDGEWMRNWTEQMKEAGALLVADGLIVNNAPEGEDTERCRAFGRALT